MLIQNNNPYQNSLQSMFTQNSGMQQFPAQNQNLCQMPGMLPQPGQQTDPLSLIGNLVSQMTSLVQGVISVIGNVVSQLTGMLTGSAGPTAQKSSDGGNFFSGITDMFGGLFGSKDSSDKGGSFLSGLGSIAGKVFGGLF